MSESEKQDGISFSFWKSEIKGLEAVPEEARLSIFNKCQEGESIAKLSRRGTVLLRVGLASIFLFLFVLFCLSHVGVVDIAVFSIAALICLPIAVLWVPTCIVATSLLTTNELKRLVEQEAEAYRVTQDNSL